MKREVLTYLALLFFISGCTQIVTAPIKVAGAVVGATVDVAGSVVHATVGSDDKKHDD